MAITLRRRSDGDPKYLHAPPDDNEEKQPATKRPTTPAGSLLHLLTFKPSNAFSHIKQSKWLRDECASNPCYRAKYEAMLEDISRMSKTELRAKYPYAHNAISNQKKRHGLDSRLHDIHTWLIHMGPRPAESWSVDRIDPKKPYAYGNMRWADKMTQTENRQDKLFRVPRWHPLPDGRKLQTKQLAIFLGQPYGTTYQALRRGRTVEDLIAQHGPRDGGEHSWDFPNELRYVLEPEFKKLRKPGQSRLDWFHFWVVDEIRTLRKGGAPSSAIAKLEVIAEEAGIKRERFKAEKRDNKDSFTLELISALDDIPDREEPAKNFHIPPPPLEPPKVKAKAQEDPKMTLEDLLAYGAQTAIP